MPRGRKDPGQESQRDIGGWLLLLVVIIVAPVAYDCFAPSGVRTGMGYHQLRRIGFDWTEYFTVRLPISAAIFGTIAFVLWFTRKRDDN